MNDLNSVLIEGIVITEPSLGVECTKSNVGVECHFRIESQRSDKLWDGIIREEHSDFDIIVRGHQGEICYERLRKMGWEDRGVRVVGRLCAKLAIVPKYPVYIIAEHIEFKPEKAGE